MSLYEEFSAGEITLGNKSGPLYGDPKIFAGVATTRAAVRAEVGDECAAGSVYHSADRMYIKIAAAGADADWYRVTATNAD